MGGATSRAQACAPRLSQLNPYVAVSVHAGPIDLGVISSCTVAVFLGECRSELVKYNRICRSCNPAVGFIAADCFGLAGFAFVDFGDSFPCFDRDGVDPKCAIVSGVTQERPGTVYTHHDRRHGFQDGDWVIFREVQGMVELNTSQPRQIKVTGPYSFTIEDTVGYSAYTREGLVSQVKVPHTMKFSPYEASCIQPVPEGGADLAAPDLAKIGRSEQLHIAVQAVLEYREHQGHMPPIRDLAAAAECVRLAGEINTAREKLGSKKTL